MPSAFTATKVPPRTSSWARSTKTSEARSLSGIGFGGSDETRRISPQPKALAPAEALGEPGQEGDGVVHLDEPGHVEDAELRLALAPPRDNREVGGTAAPAPQTLEPP